MKPLAPTLAQLATGQARAAHELRVAQSMTRGLKLTLVLGAAAMAAIGVVLVLLLTQATHNQALYERQYERLLVLNTVIATLLLGVIAWVSIRLALRLKRGKFGSQLMVKIALIFGLVGFLPGVLIYAVSYQFVSRAIESWFDVRVESALDAGLNLGRNALDSAATEASVRVRTAAGGADWPSNATSLERLREQLGALDASLWTGQQQLLASAGGSRYALSFDRPSASQIRQAKAQRVSTQLDGLDDPGTVLGPAPSVNSPRVRVLAVVPDTLGAPMGQVRFLQVTLALPANLATQALAIQDAHREYQERALARNGLKRMYIGTLSLSLFLAVFGAVLLAVLLGNQLVRPLIVLADGVREVADGDLTPKPALLTRDELGGLTRSFAQMTQQIADAREQAASSMGQLQQARQGLQTILDNQTAAVVVLDASNHIQLANPAATRVLRAPMAEFLNQPLHAVPGFADLAQLVEVEFRALEHPKADSKETAPSHWQRALTLSAAALAAEPNSTKPTDGFHEHGNANDTLHFVARGAYLPGQQRLVVIDDITDIVSAQRAQAWGEVARRLAHEIKNPLTPIQLSAERLGRKLDGKLDAADTLVLNKSVNTIVDQVDAMKRLVNEFRDYGRLPAAQLAPIDLNHVVREVLQLYPDALVRVTSLLDEACVPIAADAQQLRQVIHNLVQNAQEACLSASQSDGRNRQVLIKTQLSDSCQSVRLIILDDGPGFSPGLLRRAFEPYVTTKLKGTGLGLPVVKKIADDHHARISLSNRVENGVTMGAQVSLSFTVVKLQQSTAQTRPERDTGAASASSQH